MTKRTKTTTTEVTVQQRGGGQIVQQAKVTITESQTDYLNERGEVIETGAIQTSAVATNIGDRPKQYSEAELRTMENVGVAVVEVSREKGFDSSIALGLAATETHMGTLRSQESSAAKQSDVNPMQLSSTSGIRPTTDLRSNIAGAIDVYNRTSGSDLNTSLQTYNNQPGRAAYAATAGGAHKPNTRISADNN